MILKSQKGLFENGPPKKANGPPDNYEVKADGLSGRKPDGLKSKRRHESAWSRVYFKPVELYWHGAVSCRVIPDFSHLLLS